MGRHFILSGWLDTSGEPSSGEACGNDLLPPWIPALHAKKGGRESTYSHHRGGVFIFKAMFHFKYIFPSPYVEPSLPSICVSTFI